MKQKLTYQAKADLLWLLLAAVGVFLLSFWLYGALTP